MLVINVKLVSNKVSNKQLNQVQVRNIKLI
jgi:hypothetical protein